MRYLTALFLFLATPAMAQETYAAPNQELWNAMIQAIQNIPMSVSSHQQVQQVLANVQQQALAQARARKPPEAPDAK